MLDNIKKIAEQAHLKIDKDCDHWRVLFKGSNNFVELASKPSEYYVAEPFIIERPDGCGKQDVKLLLDAMDEIEKVQEERARRDEQLKRNLDDIMGYL
jgi:hypothetical protein